MTEKEWRRFFECCAETLGEGKWSLDHSLSWCSWTTFSRLASDCGYWQAGVPAKTDIGESAIKDGGVWGQPFHFKDLAHIVVPKTFTTEAGLVRSQPIDRLGERLRQSGIQFRSTDHVLEIKLY